MKLYDYVLSGNCYKVRLLVSILGLKCKNRPVDFYPGAEHHGVEFKKINPLGQLPVLEDEGLVIRDAQAILLYLANRYDGSRQWWPSDDPCMVGNVMQWLTFADQITATASAARLHDVLGYELDIDAARAGAHRLFRIAEDHLAEQEFHGRDWFVGSRPTIADIACFPYTALAGEGGVDLFYYPAIQRWIGRIAKLPGFVDMPGIKVFS